ncbi:hypothetical protein [Nonomuraea sp. NPDC049784]|uniref:hypothetical protein n=1 Tax=Nonomuraea sp. NPDC049784 TaxID=3154361 RepID=UPI003409BA1C
MPKSKAKTALGRTIQVIVFELLSDPTARYQDQGTDCYTRQIDIRRRTDHLVRQLEVLGHKVTLTLADQVA